MNIRVIVFLASIFSYVFMYLFMNRLHTYPQEIEQLLQHVTQFLKKRHPKNKQQSKNSQFIYPDDNYCYQSDLFKLTHPDIVSQDTYSFSELQGIHRDIIQSQYFDAMRNITLVNNKQPNKFRMPYSVSVPFLKDDHLINSFTIGKSSLCLFQKYNHMPNSNLLNGDKLFSNLNSHVLRLTVNQFDPNCIKNAKILPQTYRLYIKEECDFFFKQFQQTPIYNQYIIKSINKDQKQTILSSELLKQITSNNCSYYQQNTMIIQQYIEPLLLKGHKIELRIFWLIASTYPLIVYNYEQILIRKCSLPYNIHVRDSYVCKSFMEMSIAEFQEQLINERIIKNNNWINQQLYPMLNQLIIQIINSIEQQLVKDSKFSQLFQTDVMISDQLKITLLKVTDSPLILSQSRFQINFFYQLYNDVLEIQIAYNKSKFRRLHRLIIIIYQKMKRLKQTYKESITTRHYRNIKNGYKDQIDSGVKIRMENQFRKIIDKNEQGKSIYNNLVEEKCIE